LRLIKAELLNSMRPPPRFRKLRHSAELPRRRTMTEISAADEWTDHGREGDMHVYRKRASLPHGGICLMEIRQDLNPAGLVQAVSRDGFVHICTSVEAAKRYLDI
jgi:hypothetical protein